MERNIDRKKREREVNVRNAKETKEKKGRGRKKRGIYVEDKEKGER